ncbi:MAG: RidA family protein, partial [Pseudomonas sp.]
MIEHMTCDERFIALAKEFDYDIYGENSVGG